MQTLDWGHVTPEASNHTKNEVYYVFNHDLSSKEKINRTIRFILGRLHYYDLHLPKGSKLIATIDIRGQQVSDRSCDFISETIITKYQNRDLLTLKFAK